MKKYFILGILAVLVLFTGLVFTHTVKATVDKIYWCHVEPNGNQETLHLPLQALSGHVDAQGNILHAGDHAGACVEPTPTPTVVDCEYKDCVTPTPTEEVTPTTPPADHGDGLHIGGDNLGCSSHDCNTFPNSPQDNTPVGWK